MRTRGSGPTAGAATAEAAPDDAFARMSQSQLAALCRQMSQTQIAPSATPLHVALSSTTAGVVGPGLSSSGIVHVSHILDSGATRHVKPDESNLQPCSPVIDGFRVRLADGFSLPMVLTGTLRTSQFDIPDIYCVLA